MFRFTIRDMIWLTLVAALALGWWLHQQRLRHEIVRLELKVEDVTIQMVRAVSSRNRTIQELTRRPRSQSTSFPGSDKRQWIE